MYTNFTYEVVFRLDTQKSRNKNLISIKKRVKIFRNGIFNWNEKYL